MPCDMGMTPESVNAEQARRANRMAATANRRTSSLEDRTAELEQALCGLCQMLQRRNIELHPQLAIWFENHRQQPGCTVKESP